jgi:hypothetical protein
MGTPAAALHREHVVEQLRQNTTWQCGGQATPLDAMRGRHRRAVLNLLRVNARTLYLLRKVELERRVAASDAATAVAWHAALVHHLTVPPRQWLDGQPLVRRLVELDQPRPDGGAAMTAPLRHAARPCSECPWRRDQPVGRFPACRYDALRDTAARPGGGSAPLGAPMFACHKTAEGREIACAGWLAVEGARHVGIRLAVVSGRLDVEALTPTHEGWPDLYRSYGDLAQANGATT